MEMDYSKESLDRQEKIKNLKNAGVICYANSFAWKIDITEVRKNEKQTKEVEDLMENGAVWEYKTAGRIVA